MRYFRKQQNLIETSPAIDVVSGLPKTDLDITFKLFDKTNVLVIGSDVSLTHITGGIYRATVPVLSTLESTDYNVELVVKLGGAVVWYFYGPITVIIRESF